MMCLKASQGRANNGFTKEEFDDQPLLFSRTISGAAVMGLALSSGSLGMNAVTVSPGSKTTIIGAGIIGVVIARQLQNRGYRVTLVDRDEPAEGCSRGNAGIFAAYGVAPLSLPGILKKVPGMLFDPMGPLSIRRQHLFNMVPWLWRFWRASEPGSVERIAAALEALLGSTVSGYKALTRDTAAESLIKVSPVLCVYEDQYAYEKDRLVWGVRERHGVRWSLLNNSELRDMEPSLAERYRFAVALENCGFTLNPQRLTQLLFKEFIRDGGQFLRADVQDIAMENGKPAHLQTSAGQHSIQKVVIACGAWSGQLALRLQEPVPLQQERGYHVTLCDFKGQGPRYPIISPSQKVIATPMEMGLRVAGMVEFGGFLPPDHRRSTILRSHLAGLFPGIQGGNAMRWMGHRPSLPDSLPVIGRSSRHASVFYAFGHQHVGLTAAPMTGSVIAELLSGEKPSIDLFPFRIDRF